MKSQARMTVALFGGATMLILAVGYGGELSRSTTTPIATPTSSVTPAPPTPAPIDRDGGTATGGGLKDCTEPNCGVLLGPPPR